MANIWGQLERAQLENLSASPGSSIKGRIWFDLSSSEVKYADGASVRTLVDLGLSQTLSSKTLTSPVINTSISGSAFLDEDNLSSNDATKVASQQSIKAYVDNKIGASGTEYHLTSGDFTFQDSDNIRTLEVNVDTSGDVSTLPTLADNLDRIITVKHGTGVGPLTIQSESTSEDIETSGVNSFVLNTVGSFVTVQGTSTKWAIIGRFPGKKYAVSALSQSSLVSGSNTEITGSTVSLPAGNYQGSLSALFTDNASVSTTTTLVRLAICSSSNETPLIGDLNNSSALAQAAGAVKQGALSHSGAFSWAGGNIRLIARISTSGGTAGSLSILNAGYQLVRVD